MPVVAVVAAAVADHFYCQYQLFVKEADLSGSAQQVSHQYYIPWGLLSRRMISNETNQQRYKLTIHEHQKFWLDEVIR